jgi:hypothetical protein
MPDVAKTRRRWPYWLAGLGLILLGWAILPPALNPAEQHLVGSWTVAKTRRTAPATLKLTSDRRFRWRPASGSPALDGYWQLEGDQLVFEPVYANGSLSQRLLGTFERVLRRIDQRRPRATIHSSIVIQSPDSFHMDGGLTFIPTLLRRETAR